MNISRHRVALLLVGLFVLAAVAGCKTTPPAPPHTEAAPGPWKDIKVSIVFTKTAHAVNATVSVAGHPRAKGYVQKVQLFDGAATVGLRVFGFEDKPSETFILDDKTKKITVEITSTEFGRWVSNPRKVPRRKK